jgi:hypothetical protein
VSGKGIGGGSGSVDGNFSEMTNDDSFRRGTMTKSKSKLCPID